MQQNVKMFELLYIVYISCCHRIMKFKKHTYIEYTTFRQHNLHARAGPVLLDSIYCTFESIIFHSIHWCANLLRRADRSLLWYDIYELWKCEILTYLLVLVDWKLIWFCRPYRSRSCSRRRSWWRSQTPKAARRQFQSLTAGWLKNFLNLCRVLIFSLASFRTLCSHDSVLFELFAINLFSSG